ncbi:hypothetical protein OKW43_008111 [Paraburkholderia sp. WC7.3g]
MSFHRSLGCDTTRKYGLLMSGWPRHDRLREVVQLGYVDERRQLRILKLKPFYLIEQGQDRCRVDN